MVKELPSVLFDLRHLEVRGESGCNRSHGKRIIVEKPGWVMLQHFTSQEQRPLFRLGVDSTNVVVNHFKTNHLDCADQERARQQREPA